MSYQLIQEYLSNVNSESSPDEYSIIVSDTEKEIARKILNGDIRPEDSTFYQRAYERVKGMEKFLTGKKIAAIGMGSVPVTLIYAQKMGLIQSAFGLDIDPEAVELAHKLTTFLDVNGISYINTNGIDYNFRGLDVVFIANLVRGKSLLLEKLSNELKQGDLVILREPWDKGHFLNESVIDTLENSWEIIGKDAPCPHFYSQSFYLRKI